MRKYGLDIAYVSAYSADNASVNFGVHNSVFQKLKAENGGILKANCICHVIHNAGRNACKALSFDVENLVLKVYAEFSNSAKKNSKLKECFAYLDMEYEIILKHGITRWLSLLTALERLILAWPAVKSYFLELGEDSCNKVVWDFIKTQENELEDDLSGRLSFHECYIYFVHHYMMILNATLLKLQSNSLTSSEVHPIMEELVLKLTKRLQDNFFGSKVKSALRHLKASEQKKFMEEANRVYQRSLEYIMKYYNLETTPFKNVRRN